MKILTLTTSYPTIRNPSSGAFIRRFLSGFPKSYYHYIVTPATTPENDFILGDVSGKVSPGFYAPRRWSTLFHGPGGGPAALLENSFLLLLLPFCVVSLFVRSLGYVKKVDVIHGHWSLCGCVSGVLGSLFSVPTVVTLHGQDVNRASSSILLSFLLWATVVLNDRVVTVSSDMYTALNLKFPKYRGKFRFISNGVSDDFLGVERKFSKFPNRLRLLVVSSLIRSKAVDVVLCALSYLPRSFNVELHIVGEGPEMKALELKAEHFNIGSKIKFKGLVAPEKMHDIYAGADIFISASREEGRPSVLMEAMAATLPCLVSDIKGHRELSSLIAGDVLFPVDDSLALSEKLKVLLVDAALRERVAVLAHQAIVKNGLTWPDTVESYLEQYSELIQ